MTHAPVVRHTEGVVLAVPGAAGRRASARRLTDVRPKPLGDILTVEQVADRMNMSVRYVRRLISTRRIAFHRIGRSIRIATVDVDAHIAACRVEPLSASDAWRDLKSAV